MIPNESVINTALRIELWESLFSLCTFISFITCLLHVFWWPLCSWDVHCCFCVHWIQPGMVWWNCYFIIIWIKNRTSKGRDQKEMTIYASYTHEDNLFFFSFESWVCRWTLLWKRGSRSTITTIKHAMYCGYYTSACNLISHNISSHPSNNFWKYWCQWSTPDSNTHKSQCFK